MAEHRTTHRSCVMPHERLKFGNFQHLIDRGIRRIDPRYFNPDAAVRWVLAGSVLLILVGNVAGCSSESSSYSEAAAPSARSIVVLAASSLKPTFRQIAEQFKTENPGASIEFEFAVSSQLANHLMKLGQGDVFASADSAQMDTVAKAGLLAGTSTNFASNTLVIVTAPGNPDRVGSFADLANPRLTLAVCQLPVPCGSATRRIEDMAGVQLDPVTDEPTATDVLDKVSGGQVDAGLVYITDALNAGKNVTMVRFPEAAYAVNEYPVAVLKQTPQPGLARKFVDLVTGETGQKILGQAGFGKP